MKTGNLQKRIKNRENLQSIIRTMKALAGVSIQQHEKSRQGIAEYREVIETSLHAILRRKNFSFAPPARGEKGIVIIGSDHGLCGSFNESVCNHGAEAASGVSRIITLGERTLAGMEERKIPVETSFPLPSGVRGTGKLIYAILEKIREWQELNIYSIEIIYNQPVKKGFVPAVMKVYPPDVAWLNSLRSKKWESASLPAFPENPEKLFSLLVREHIHISLLSAVTESLVAENTSRLTTMQRAEKNLDESLNEAVAEFRQERQKAITDELLDIISGYNLVRSANSKKFSG